MGDSESTEVPPTPLPYGEDPRAEEEERKPHLVARDPVCGMALDAEGTFARSVYQGTSYNFCTLACKAAFDFEPSRYVG